MSAIKNRVFIGGIAAAILIMGGITLTLINQPETTTTGAVQGAQATQQQSDTHVTFVATKGKNILSQLKEHASVDVKGTAVTAINGNAQNGKSWSVYVDGQLVREDIKTYITRGGEKVEWKLE